jgi:hypothetical protein
MKAILISGDGDFCAVHFENKFGGTPVMDIIQHPESFYPDQDDEDEDETWSIEVIEVGEVDPRFVTFIRNEIEDYETSKNVTFYLENEKVRK